jgi:hypothetical protein
MSVQYHQTLITPFEVRALHNLIARAEGGPDKQVAYRWLCHARSGLFAEWQALPDGHHLKDAYRDEVWQWDDQDLASIPEDRLVSPEDLPAIGEDIDE